MTAKRLFKHIVNKFMPVMTSEYKEKKTYNERDFNFVSVIIF